MADAPHAGLRVVELARILAGPWIGQTLADLGADVIKVEAPEGDDTRRWGPPFVAGANGDALDAAYFHCCNRGKRSVVADFNSADDLRLVHALVDRADVLIENFRTGGLKRFGLDYDSVRARNPRIVYCSVTGFGQDGPYARRPGYDAIIQGMSGMMSITGAADGPPQKVGVAIADIFTGVYGVIGVQAALAQRERTGLGQQVDMALLDSMVAVLANQAMNFFISGEAPRRMGSSHPNLVPYQDFSAADGPMMVAVGSDGQFAKLCALLGRPELGADERFRSNAARVRHRGELVPLLQTLIGSRRRCSTSSSRPAFPPVRSTASTKSSATRSCCSVACASTCPRPAQPTAPCPDCGRRSASPARRSACSVPRRDWASTRSRSPASLGSISLRGNRSANRT